MITCNLQGGLGNQLFQIFATISYAMENNIEFCFLYTPNRLLNNTRPTYWNNLFINLKKYTVNEMPNNLIRGKEPYFHYHRINYLTNINVMLDGYYQSEKYFNKMYEQIYQLIQIDNLKNNIIKKHDDMNNYISLHYRYDDYKKLSMYVLLPIQYYINSIRYMIEKYKSETLIFLCFYQKSDEKEAYLLTNNLKNMFKSCQFLKINHNISDWEQLLHMSLCKGNIIANSTFSWWGAYLNNTENKIVCAPSKWFNHTHNTKDLIPSNWNKINF